MLLEAFWHFIWTYPNKPILPKKNGMEKQKDDLDRNREAVELWKW